MPPAVPQRLCLVLPSTGEFDSRTYRIASAAAARGHTVTVLARWKAGQPRSESHPAGYRIVRVPYAALDGLPLAGAVRMLLSWRRRPGSRSAAGPRAEALAAGQGAPGAVHDPGASAPPAPSLPGRLARRLVRRFAIPLTIRSQGRSARLAAPEADLYHGMAYMGIPIALDLARRAHARVVYDARDIYLDAANLARLGGPARWFVARAERGWARRADRVVTVNRPYAEVMAERFGVPLPLIVMNCSYRRELPATPPRRFHEVLSLPPAVRVVLYQGGFSRDRGIEELCSAIALLEGAVLVCLGYGVLEPELRARAAEPQTGGRLHVLPAVPPEELLDWVASADVVAMPIQPTTLNHRLTTPNKLFEAMAAGVPVVASDLPGMASIVRETGCGVLCDPLDPVNIAAAIRSVLDAPPEIRAAFRRHAAEAVAATYNWESQAARLFAEYGRLTGRPW